MALKKWLPLGSVVNVREKSEDIVIISRGFIVPQKTTFVYYDYCGIDANQPIQNSPTYLFNTDSVEDVVFIGWNSLKQEQLETRFFKNVISKGVKKAKVTLEQTGGNSF